MTEPVDATIVIATHNRKDELRRAVASALEQGDGVRVEVSVFDDASTDGTDAMIREEFPQILYQRAETNVGPCIGRNRAVEVASGRVLIFIDDDAMFPTPGIVRQTLDDFDDDRIGSVAIPYIDVLVDDRVRQAAPDREGYWVTAIFRATACAIRTDVFRGVNGLREALLRQGEEYEFCLRMFNAGYALRLGRSEPIHHYESVKRVRAHIFELALRNWIITTALLTPLIQLAPQLATKTVNGVMVGVSRRWPLTAVRGLCRGYGYALGHLHERSPVKTRAFHVFRKLWRSQVREQCMPLDEVIPPKTPM